MYKVSCIFFNKCIFHITWLDTFWTDLMLQETSEMDKWEGAGEGENLQTKAVLTPEKKEGLALQFKESLG